MPPLRKVGPFKLIEELADGSSGTTLWRARNSKGEEVALKLIPKPRDEQALRKTKGYFDDEVEAGKTLKGPHIRALLSSGEIADARFLHYRYGAFYLALELVEFGSLRDLLHQRALEAEEIRDLVVAVARGLVEAHSHEPAICHRDLKP